MDPSFSGSYRDVIDNMGLALAIYRAVDDGEDFIFVEVNSGVEEIEQVKKEDLIGKRVTEAFPGVEEFGLLDVFRRVYKSGVPERHPVSMYTDNRISGWRDNYVYRLETGEVVAVYRDIIEQKQFEKMLAQSEERYRSLVEDSPVAISVTVDSEIVYVSPERLKLTGHTSKEALIGVSGLDSVVSEDQESIRERTDARMRGEEISLVTRFKMRTVDGGVIHVVDYMSDIMWEGKAAVMHILQDITKQGIYEARLEALHRHAVSAGDIYTVDGVAQIIMEILKSVLDLRTCNFGVVEGNTLSFKYQSTPLPVMDFPLDGPGVTVRAVKTGETQIIPDVRLDPDYVVGLTSLIRSELAVPLKIEDRVVAVINIESEELDAFTDEDRQLVEILGEHAASALEKIRYVGEVERVEKMRSREMIEGTARVTSMVKHDLKGPLSVIKNSVYMIRKGVGNTEKTLDLINENVDRAAELLNDLGTLTLTGDMTRVLGDLVDVVRDTVYNRNPPDNVEVVVNNRSEVIICNVDFSKFRRVIDNLVINGFEAMPEGGILSVDIGSSDGVVVITVEDTGVGMPVDVQGKVFNPFFTTKINGVGLGLSICKQVVEAHGGTIGVESKLGEGTRFTVKMPI